MTPRVAALAAALAPHIRDINHGDFNALRAVVRDQSARLGIPFDEAALRDAWLEWWMSPPADNPSTH